MELIFTAADGIGRIELSAPPRNALVTPAFAQPARLSALLADDDLSAAIIVGSGRNFSAGADPDVLAARISADPDALGEELAAGKRALDAIRYAPIPVIAAIRGACLGAGLEIALACHFRIASTTAVLGFPEAEHGLLPGLGGTLLTTSGVPRGAAVDLLLSGRTIRGEDAAAIRLVDAAVPTAAVERTARELALRLVAGRSRSQIRKVMAAVHNAERLDRPAALAEETRLFVELAQEAARRGAGSGA